jgi:predicted nuclease of restriction endonuclease-like (RecB) superfamily
MKPSKHDTAYQQLVQHISETYAHTQLEAARVLRQQLVNTYWNIGRYIVEFEQAGKERAGYGQGLLENLSRDLALRHGKGFSLSNMKRMRQFYLIYPILATISQELGPKGATPSHLLSWSHYVELLKIDDELERNFYEQQTLLENWSITELKRQKKSSLFLRLAASRDKEGILQLSRQGQLIEKPADILREPYVLDFLQIPETHQLKESHLEDKIISQLQQFLLELGKGFAFIGRQYRITLGNQHYYVDLVFYHRILKCFVLIDLKSGEAGYEDVGQMNMYLGYFEQEENTEGDNPPIGIVLCREKDEFVIKYATHNISSKLFVSKYQLYLPDSDTLKAIVEKQLISYNSTQKKESK